MKKILVFVGLLLSILGAGDMVYAAGVTPEVYSGDDSNPSEYTPPARFIHYEIPNSGTPGFHTVKLNSAGAVDPEGGYVFTVLIGEVGTETGETYTEVFSWSSNFPLYGVIVRGGDGFNLYPYNNDVHSDTNLAAPYNSSGQAAGIFHVSIVYNPAEFPADSKTTVGSGLYSAASLIAAAAFILIIILSLLFIIALLIMLCKFCKLKNQQTCSQCPPCLPGEPDVPKEPCEPQPPCNSCNTANPRRQQGLRRNNMFPDNNRH